MDFDLEYYENNIEKIIKIQKLIKKYLNNMKKKLLIINNLINNNIYINNCKKNNKKDVNSISFLINKTLSQSECIKLGYGIEKVLCDIIKEFTTLINIRPKNTKGNKEKDHLFYDEKNKVIYYAELKSNINLYTEKSKMTYTKCLDIIENLKTEYNDCEIKWCIVACRYIRKEDIPKNLIKKFEKVKDNLFGINDYFKMLNLNLKFNIKNYCLFLNKISDTMFKNS
jgi:hypothetical protein